MVLSEVGDLIRKRRESFGMDRVHLAEMTGVAERTVFLLETGKGNPSFQTLESVLNTLGMEFVVRVKKSI